MIDEKIKALFRAIKEKNFENEGAKTHDDNVSSILCDAYTRKIEARKTQHYPKIILTRKLIDEFNYSANEVSRKFQSPTELIGTCSGIEKGENIYVRNFHVFHNQSCNSVKTKTSGLGNIKTYSELKRKNLASICVAHSHNDFNVFHSPTDENLIRKNTLGSTPKKTFQVGDLEVPMKYSMDIVFNHRTGRESRNPFIKCAVSVPKPTKDGWDYETVDTFEPQFKILPYGNMDEFTRERLTSEIEERVNFLSEYGIPFKKSA